MFLTAYGFHQATYELTSETIASFEDEALKTKLMQVADQSFENDIAFKNSLKSILGPIEYATHESQIIASAISMNPFLVLIGILGFVASFRSFRGFFNQKNKRHFYL